MKRKTRKTARTYDDQLSAVASDIVQLAVSNALRQLHQHGCVFSTEEQSTSVLPSSDRRVLTADSIDQQTAFSLYSGHTGRPSVQMIHTDSRRWGLVRSSSDDQTERRERFVCTRTSRRSLSFQLLQSNANRVNKFTAVIDQPMRARYGRLQPIHMFNYSCDLLETPINVQTERLELKTKIISSLQSPEALEPNSSGVKQCSYTVTDQPKRTARYGSFRQIIKSTHICDLLETPTSVQVERLELITVIRIRQPLNIPASEDVECRQRKDGKKSYTEDDLLESVVRAARDQLDDGKIPLVFAENMNKTPPEKNSVTSRRNGDFGGYSQLAEEEEKEIKGVRNARLCAKPSNDKETSDRQPDVSVVNGGGRGRKGKGRMGVGRGQGQGGGEEEEEEEEEEAGIKRVRAGRLQSKPTFRDKETFDSQPDRHSCVEGRSLAIADEPDLELKSFLQHRAISTKRQKSEGEVPSELRFVELLAAGEFTAAGTESQEHDIPSVDGEQMSEMNELLPRRQTSLENDKDGWPDGTAETFRRGEGLAADESLEVSVSQEKDDKEDVRITSPVASKQVVTTVLTDRDAFSAHLGMAPLAADAAVSATDANNNDHADKDGDTVDKRMIAELDSETGQRLSSMNAGLNVPRSCQFSANEVFEENEDLLRSPMSAAWGTPYKSQSSTEASPSVGKCISSFSPLTVEQPSVDNGKNEHEQSSDRSIDFLGDEANGANHDLAKDQSHESGDKSVPQHALSNVVETSSLSIGTSADQYTPPIIDQQKINVKASSSVCQGVEPAVSRAEETGSRWKSSANGKDLCTSSQRQNYDRLDDGDLSEGPPTERRNAAESGSSAADEDADKTVDLADDLSRTPTDVKHLHTGEKVDAELIFTPVSDDDEHKKEIAKLVTQKKHLTEPSFTTEDSNKPSLDFQRDLLFPDWRLSTGVREIIEKQSIGSLAVQTEVDLSHDTIQTDKEVDSNQRLKSRRSAARRKRPGKRDIDSQASKSKNWKNERPEMLCPAENISEIYLESGMDVASGDVIVYKDEPAPILVCEETAQRVQLEHPEAETRAADETDKRVSAEKLETSRDAEQQGNELDAYDTENDQEIVSQARSQSDVVETSNKRRGWYVDDGSRTTMSPATQRCLSAVKGSQENSETESSKKQKLERLRRLSDTAAAESESMSKAAARIWQLAGGKQIFTRGE